MATSQITYARATMDCEARFAADDAGVFNGYAARFGELNAHNEIVVPGAFARTLADHAKRGLMPPMLWSHDQAEPVGVWEDIREDATGLAVRGRLILETAKGREAHALLKARAISGLSIGFRSRRATRAASGATELRDADLFEISLVTLPSAGNARIANVRSLSGLAGFTEAIKAASLALRSK